MNANNVFIGTVAELADKLFAEFDGAWAMERIYFSPSEDVIASDITGEDASLVFGDTHFDGSYLNFDGVFHTGCVYQLIFAAVYKVGEDTVSFAPNVEGEWAAWDAYWQEHEPDNNLQLYAAVMLLEGESLSYGAGGLTGLENTANKVTSIDGDSTDEQYPSAKAVYTALTVMIDSTGEALADKQDKPLYFNNIYIMEIDWQATYMDPVYICVYQLSDSRITADMVATPYYSIADEASGNFAQHIDVVDGQLLLYAKDALEITIPLIKCERTS